ncbi:MAG: deoxyribodipyrimidine photolyase [Methanomicrobiales archaeon HGW-Methanomicrobiales-4]|nr:MAG: deoxyribodipyrimidine photolyase [Methanomicrobiales archaeon HGW-Methanomicrobiales-4]
MQDAVRTEGNHALEYAIQEANTLKKPLIVLFSLTDQFPEATIRQYTFLVEGLIEVDHLLAERGIRLHVSLGDPVVSVPAAAEDACLMVADCGHLRHQRQWRENVWERVSCPKVMIETGVIVPVVTASPKMEWSAGTFRPKITRQLPRFLIPLPTITLLYPSLGWDNGGLPFKTAEDLTSCLTLDQTIPPVTSRGGEISAKAQLSWFTRERLHRYGDSHSDPTARATSRLSSYLHFGQISPLSVALEVMAAKSPGNITFLEQLIVRRELAMNFVYYNPGYDSYDFAIPDWSKRTLSLHQNDIREYAYTRTELEVGVTHDPYWNAMQTELVLTGYLHGYLRMYWGKKILEWSETPEEAFDTALFLNNRYELDGYDPNGYTGVAWCFGRHDRPWKERSIFGMVRYMNDAGLKRKFKIDAYRERVELMAAEKEDSILHHHEGMTSGD